MPALYTCFYYKINIFQQEIRIPDRKSVHLRQTDWEQKDSSRTAHRIDRSNAVFMLKLSIYRLCAHPVAFHTYKITHF